MNLNHGLNDEDVSSIRNVATLVAGQKRKATDDYLPVVRKVVKGVVESGTAHSPIGEGTNCPAGTLEEASYITLAQLNAALAPLNAKVGNVRLRSKNSRLQPNQAWLPLQRDKPQVLLPNGQLSAAPGELPPAGAIPDRTAVNGLSVMTLAHLQALSEHYGETFDTWTELEDYFRH